MADIRPFAAYRPRADLVEKIASLPYDVYSRQEAYELTRGDDYSFLRIDRPETQFEPEHDIYADDVYNKARDMLRDEIEEGRFVHEDKPVYYIYAQTFKGRTQTGIVAVSSVQDYVDGVIKKHENTRADKEADRIRHVDTCNAQTGPIFLAYRQNEAIEAVISRVMKTDPLYDFTKYETRQQVWIISEDSDIDTIQKAFADTDSIYIADGHHRCASACRVALNRRSDPSVPEESEAEHFLSVLFPDNELMIMDYNRVIKDLNGLTSAEFLDKVREVYEVVPADEVGNNASGTDATEADNDIADAGVLGDDGRIRLSHKGQCGLYLNDKWYLLKYDQNKLIGDPVADLDVAILQDRILRPVLGIDDPKTDKRIDFVGGIRGIEELERRCHNDCVCAFAMYPTDIHELFAVADAGLLMPPKSTWFEPKLLSGIFIHDIKENK